MNSAQSEDTFFQFLFEFSVPDCPKGDGYRLMAHLSSVSQGLLCSLLCWVFSMPKPSHPLLWVRKEYSQCKWLYNVYKLSPRGLASRTILCLNSSSHTQPSYHALYREGAVWSPSPNPPDITRERGNYSQQLCWSSLFSLGRPLNSSEQAGDHMWEQCSVTT